MNATNEGQLRPRKVCIGSRNKLPVELTSCPQAACEVAPAASARPLATNNLRSKRIGRGE
jgi:hypothetical protein